MKRKYLLLSAVLVLALAFFNTGKVMSNKDFARPGYCGDPTTSNTCVYGGCHGGTNQTITPQNLVITLGSDSNALSDTLNANFKYVPGKQYYVRFSVLATGYAFGFQTIALDASNNPAGTFAVTSPHTKLVAGYMTHLIATQGYNSWLFSWTAPASNDGPVTFYYAFNAADSIDFGNYTNAVPSSNIFVGTTTIQYQPGVGINEVANNISQVQLYPNPTSGVFDFTFNALKSGNSSAAVYSIDGKLCKSLFNENINIGEFNRIIDISSLPAGIYLLQLSVNGATETRKIVKV